MFKLKIASHSTGGNVPIAEKRAAKTLFADAVINNTRPAPVL